MNYIKYLRDRVGHDAVNVTGVNVLVINSDDQVLLQRRGTFPFKWGLVGGITELGESLEDTAVRETREETGLDVRELILLGTTSGDNCLVEFPDGDKTYFISIGYYTKEYSGELKIDNLETKELKFFDYDELPDNLPGSHKEMINKYYERD